MPNSGRYSQILRASSLIGGSQAVNMVFGLVRTKLIAVMIGPAGIGLIGAFQSIIGLASTLAGLGIHQSGVRDVAVAAGKDDQEKLGRTVLTLRRVCWLSGLIGFSILFFAGPWICHYTFENNHHVNSIRIIGLTLLLGNITAGQAAIIQGTRRIGDIARIAIIGSISSTFISGIAYYTLGIDGIAPAMLCISIATLTVSTFYARQVEVPQVNMTWMESLTLAGGLFSLGFAFLWTGLLTTFVTYLTNAIVAREIGMDAVGVYAAAFTLSGLFVQFVLKAMSADYYPRLTQASNDNEQMNVLINEQTEIGLLLAFPGLLATLSLAPIAIRVLYTSEFLQSAELLRWFILGCMGRIISWPMGFAMLAKGKGGLFAFAQTFFNAIHLLLIVVGVRWFGVAGVAIAFFGLYAIHVPAVLFITRTLTGFMWHPPVLALFYWMAPVAIACLLMSLYLPREFSPIPCMMVSIGSGVHSLRQLIVRVGPGNRIAQFTTGLPGGKWLLRGL
ncbi:colanic acid exporter [Rosistilla oblonga]|uniref:O-antigen translocase n=1 Tax=Rosistilla oblonga TaxID=2527990 RepID=UPI001187CB6C|nr:O-antigen translocase [Rosistilla oblonga]QDV12562.1 colanic acid exporter [Rosistilla oblonga]